MEADSTQMDQLLRMDRWVQQFQGVGKERDCRLHNISWDSNTACYHRPSKRNFNCTNESIYILSVGNVHIQRPIQVGCWACATEMRSSMTCGRSLAGRASPQSGRTLDLVGLVRPSTSPLLHAQRMYQTHNALCRTPRPFSGYPLLCPSVCTMLDLH